MNWTLSLWTLLLLMVPLVGALRAQEINCNVEIIDDAVPSADRQAIEQMNQAITTFMNGRRWTEDQYSVEERINCNLVITLGRDSDLSTGRYQAAVQIQSSRPVHGTGYETLLFNYLDKKWSFTYVPNQPMDFNVNTYLSDLTSLLGFYAYVILGYDYDSFGKLGGRQHFLTAQQIAGSAAQAGTTAGWRAFDGARDRYWLTENMLNTQVEPFRQGLYSYHRLSLDAFEQNQDDARAQVLSMLEATQGVLRQKPLCLVVNLFFEAKAGELVSIFSQAAPQEKQRAYNLLVELDRNSADQYEELTN
ncbi:MAG: DUF4835 family protein [Catalinimonas sp.]